MPINQNLDSRQGRFHTLLGGDFYEVLQHDINLTAYV